MSEPSSAPKPPGVLSVALASGAAAALTAAYVLRVYLPTYNTPHTPVARVAHARVPASEPAIARRVVFAVLDGLSFDLARELEELAPLRRAGAMRMLVPAFPTYTSPALVSFVTGLDPLDHGIRLNGRLTGALGLDTVTRAAHDAGMTVGLRKRGWDPFEEVMYPSREAATPFPLRAPAEADVIAGRMRFAWSLWKREAGREVLPQLEIFYFEDVDSAGHRHGGASPEYVAAAHHVGAVVARLAATMDLAEETLVLASDHSHRAEGGHGGLEPEVRRAMFLAVGRGVRRGVELGPRPPKDVASTLSLLAGLRPPGSNLGRPMLDVLEVEGAARARALAAPFAQASRFACGVRASRRCGATAGIAQRLSDGDAVAVIEAEALLDGMGEERVREDAARAAAGQRTRLGIAIAIVAAGVVALRRWLREELAGTAQLLPLALLHAVIYAGTMAALGNRATFSAMVGENYNRDTFFASVAAFTATMAVVILGRQGPFAPWALLSGTAVPVALLAAWVGADPAMLAPAVEGAVLFQIAPLVLSAAATAMAARIVERWPERFR